MEIGASLVYILCLATSALCAALLARAYVRSRATLLLWSAVCFALLALNNLLVVADVLLLPDVDLTNFRLIASLTGVGAMLYAFIWEID
jgi:hypothetical protein